MTFDLVIRNGRLIDGTGRPGQRADVGITGGVITALGTADGPATREIEQLFGFTHTF